MYAHTYTRNTRILEKKTRDRHVHARSFFFNTQSHIHVSVCVENRPHLSSRRLLQVIRFWFFELSTATSHSAAAAREHAIRSSFAIQSSRIGTWNRENFSKRSFFARYQDWSRTEHTKSPNNPTGTSPPIELNVLQESVSL